MEPEPPSLFLLFIGSNDWLSLSVGLILLIVLLVSSALISGSEVAFFSLKKKDIDNAKEESLPRIELIHQLLKDKKKLLATILVINNFINIGIVLLSAYLSKEFLHPLLNINIGGVDLKILFDVVIITFIILLFGEIIPKIYAAKNPLSFSQMMAKPLNFLQWLVKPISQPLLWLSGLLESRLKTGQTISVDQLSQALELTSEDETTTSDEQKILEGIVSFGNTETRQIMTPRVDVFSLKSSVEFEKVIELISSNGFSRVPVYTKSIDEIKGILYAKDLLPYLNQENFDWIELLRKPFFVPENKKLDDLLNDFQERKNHLAVVVDEYGGTSGIVTLEDVLEEVVGDISDEFDDENILYSKLDTDNYLFEGKTSLKDFYRIMDVEEEDDFEGEKGEAETLAGFVLEIIEETPKRRQKINFENYTFTIESIDNRRIKRIKVTRSPDEDENA